MFQLNILFWYEERMGTPHPFLPLIVVPKFHLSLCVQGHTSISISSFIIYYPTRHFYKNFIINFCCRN